MLNWSLTQVTDPTAVLRMIRKASDTMFSRRVRASRDASVFISAGHCLRTLFFSGTGGQKCCGELPLKEWALELLKSLFIVFFKYLSWALLWIFQYGCAALLHLLKFMCLLVEARLNCCDGPARYEVT